MKVIMPDVRIAFASIFSPSKMTDDQNATPRYSVTSLIEPGSATAKAIMAAVKEVAAEKWGDKSKGILDGLVKKDRICYHTVEKTNKKGEIYDGFAGMHFVTASCEVRPQVVDRNKSPLTQADGRPYGGCYCNIIVDIWAQDNKFGQRVNAKLGAIQFVKDGAAFSGGAVMGVDDFEVVESAEDFV